MHKDWPPTRVAFFMFTDHSTAAEGGTPWRAASRAVDNSARRQGVSVGEAGANPLDRAEWTVCIDLKKRLFSVLAGLPKGSPFYWRCTFHRRRRRNAVARGIARS